MSSTEPLSPRLQQAFAQLIADRIGLTLRKNDQASFQNFIFSRLEAIEFKVPEEYYLLLNENTEQSNQEWTLLISTITNIESFFFRDKGQFNLLKNYILPTLIEQRSREKTLRICSAGCSTGEEPYSIAILLLLADLIPDLNDWDLKILGIDINSTAIERAKAGIYRPWSFRGVESAILERFFKESDNHYQIDGVIKEMVDFQIGNLVDSSFLDPPLDVTDMDLILCRNVFIYFNNAAIGKILDKFYNALRPSGYLLVGHTELHGQQSNKLHIKMFDESIAYQRPVNEATQPASEFIMTPPIPVASEPAMDTCSDQELNDLFKGSDIRMNQVALNLLRQLPGDSRIAKLGNRTASELILQLEHTLKETD